MLIIILLIGSVAMAGTQMRKNTKVKYGLYFQVEVINQQVSDKVYQRYQTVEQFALNNSALNYRFGVFAKYATADEEVGFLKSNGIDAYVVAYFNKARITLEEAIVLATDQSKYETGLYVENKEITVKDLNNLIYEKGKDMEVTYRVYFGTFTKQEPLPDFDVRFTFQVTPEGFYSYVSQDFKTRSEAINFRKEAVKKGVVEAYVVPYLNGRRISLLLADAINEVQSSDIAELIH